jgi:hypothetical protein
MFRPPIGPTLSVDELIDIDIKKFERDNNICIRPNFNNLQDSEAKSGRSRSAKSTALKKKYSELHLNVGLGKRAVEFCHDERRESRARWESLNVKKDHLKKFAQKSMKHRIL